MDEGDLDERCGGDKDRQARKRKWTRAGTSMLRVLIELRGDSGFAITRRMMRPVR